MACSITISGRTFPCKTGLAGVKKVWIKRFVGTEFDAPVNGESAANPIEPATTVEFFEFEPTRNAASLVATPTVSVENGSLYYAQVLDGLNFPVLTAADTAKFADLFKSRLLVIVQDANDNYLLMGRTMGVEATGGAFQTGAAAGDLHGYSIQFTVNEGEPPAHIDPDDSALLLTSAT